MPICDECGDEYRTLANVCRYCDDQFCPRHRLPENHDCPGLSETAAGTRHFESSFDDSTQGRTESKTDRGDVSPQPMESVRTYGGSGKDRSNADFDSSPGVRADGSIESDGTDSERVANNERDDSLATWGVLLLTVVVLGCGLLLWLAF